MTENEQSRQNVYLSKSTSTPSCNMPNNLPRGDNTNSLALAVKPTGNGVHE
jgi:hypothetical protein